MKALVYGSLNLDYVYQVEHFVQAGETISSMGMNCFCGGKGLNQSIALRKAGADTWHAGAVGEGDSAILFQALESAKVDTSLISKKDMPSGHAIIQNNREGDNCILLFGGANQSITEKEIKTALEGFGAGDFLILQNEINGNAEIMQIAHARGMKIVLNPSPMDEKILRLPLNLVDYFIVNEIEGQAIVNGCGAEENQVLANALAACFPDKEIILTLGSHGSMYIHNEERIDQKIYPVKAVDTTAAGDTFTGYFFGSIMNGKSIKEALDMAAKASAIAVSRRGASPSIPELEEVNNFQA